MVLAIQFSVSGNAYAVPCQRVIEVMPLLELRAVPRAPAWLAGVFAYHGALVSVVDACQLIGGYECSKRLSSRVAIVHCVLPELGDVVVGLLAERMTAVRRLEGTPLIASAPGSLPYLDQVVQEGAELVHLIDVEGLVRATRLPEGDPSPRLGEALA